MTNFLKKALNSMAGTKVEVPETIEETKEVWVEDKVNKKLRKRRQVITIKSLSERIGECDDELIKQLVQVYGESATIRINRAIELRLQGLQLDFIAKKMEDEGYKGCSKPTIRRYIKCAYDLAEDLQPKEITEEHEVKLEAPDLAIEGLTIVKDAEGDWLIYPLSRHSLYPDVEAKEVDILLKYLAGKTV